MTTPFPFVANTVLTAAQLNAITTLPVNAKTANYTLVVGDVGQRVQMTNASATTITVNTGIFAAGDTIWIQNMGAGTCTITAGTATVSTASSLALAQYGGGTLVFQSASAATFFSQQAASYGTATGGSSSSITVSSVNYTLLTFTTDGTLTVTKAGLFDYLVIGAGAGSSNLGGNGAGGGGAGQLVEGTIYFSANQTVTIGAGGAVNSTPSGTTRCGTVFALGGSGVRGGGIAGSAGASGAGGEGFGSVIAGGTAQINTVTGYAGGSGSNNSTNGYPGGGGGGMGAVGGNASIGVAGTAGTGVSNSFNSVATTYCRGGFGGSYNGTANAAANLGNGGGNSIGNAGAGGSGLVLVRFKV